MKYCKDEVLVAEKSALLLQRLNAALGLLENTAEFSVKFGKGDFDPYWLIDEAADLIAGAIYVIEFGGANK